MNRILVTSVFLAICQYASAASTGNICKVAGDPFYSTFDGARLEFQGKCIYNFATYSVLDCDPCDETVPDPVAEQFSIYVENTATPHDNTRSYTSRAHLDVANHRISLREQGKVLVDEVDRTEDLNEGEIIIGSQQNVRISKIDTEITIIVSKLNDDGDLVDQFILTWDARGPYGRHVLTLQLLDAAYQNVLTGICGNYDGDEENDHTAKDTQLISSDTEVGNSWVANTVSCL